MFGSSMTKIRRRGLLLLMLGLLAQLMLLKHLVYDEHEHEHGGELSCEVCLLAKQPEFAIASSAPFILSLLVFFVGVAVVAIAAPSFSPVRGFAPRAPPG